MILRKMPLIAFALLSLSSCRHISQKIYSIPIRASKPRIFKELGAPFKAQRKNGMDYWTYKFILDGRHYTQTLVIKRGMLFKKEKLKPYSLKRF